MMFLVLIRYIYILYYNGVKLGMIYNFVSSKCDKALKVPKRNLFSWVLPYNKYLLMIRILSGDKRLVKIFGLKYVHISVWGKTLFWEKPPFSRICSELMCICRKCYFLLKILCIRKCQLKIATVSNINYKTQL